MVDTDQESSAQNPDFLLEGKGDEQEGTFQNHKMEMF